MSSEYILIENSPALKGEVHLIGAKNSVLAIMASLILTKGKNILRNVPFSDDVTHMIRLLETLGARVQKDEAEHVLEIDTTHLSTSTIGADIMKKMRASILVMGPLLARMKVVQLALPGGCVLGARPIDFHIRAFTKMGASFRPDEEYLVAEATQLKPIVHVLEYPSVGATENIMMAAALIEGTTKIINAAIEPEVLDLIDVLRKMGVSVSIEPPATIIIRGQSSLQTVEHSIMYDRLEAGSLLLAAALTGGELSLPQAPASMMDVFLDKLEEMGHKIKKGADGTGIWLQATPNPHAVSFRTMPYPGFPTDLQAPMMVLQCLASGKSTIQETVFENRLVHVRELQKMGAQISVEGTTAIVVGVDELYGASVIAPDIRGGYALLIAGLVAQGQTTLTGVHHLKRGYDGMVEKLISLGARINVVS